ncbi:MAG: ATP-dependent RNA helicase HrpA [Desulfosalsimonadaceae bacterium]
MEHSEKIKQIESLLPKAMHADRHAAKSKLKRLRRRKKAGDGGKTLNLLESRLRRSIVHKRKRRQNRPALLYPQNLPIVERKEDVVSAIADYQVVVISGETGSGKTTQIPKFCLEAGRGVEGAIGCTQPRRIAAVTVANRIAAELGEEPGQSVGYQIRFQDRFNKEDGFVKVMTDGILLAEAQGDKYLNDYDTLIVDEAHERSLNIDFILGILRRLLKTRKDLKLIITSATIDTEKFSRAFDNAPVIEVSGRMYPVELRHEEPAGNKGGDDLTYVEKAVEAVDEVVAEKIPGDVLVFMPTEQDIRETCEMIEGRGYPHTTVLPLYARLSAADQMRVFQSVAGRKIVVATNVAETSITVPGIRYVIDTGLARISRYEPRSRTTQLPVSPISKSSADQRKGRCGRVESGVCIRLYSEFDYESRPLFTLPEIQRSNLSEVILRMLSLNLGDIQSFPFIDPPPARQIKDGFDLLHELGAIVAAAGKKKAGEKSVRLTRRGRVMAGIPLDPRLSRMLLEAASRGCLAEMTVIASALTIIDPRERPEGAEEKADAAHRRFFDPSSDFVTWVNIWRACFGAPGLERAFVRAKELKRFCRENWFSFKRMREWQDVHEQIVLILNESGICGQAEEHPEGAAEGEQDFSPRYSAIHCSILSGFLSNIAMKKEKNIYQAARNREMMIFPGSGVFGRGGPWTVAAGMVATSRLFGRNVANIDRTWLEPIGRGLCRYTYLNPRWEKKPEAVMADEQVSLFGLIVEPGRPRPYGPVDPEGAAEIFIREALIGGEVKKELPFMQHNREQAESIRDMENRFRRRDLLVGEAAMLEFYRERLGTVYDMAGLKKKIKKKGSDEFLRMVPQDLMTYDPDEADLEQFPDSLCLGGDGRFSVKYRFEPGAPVDGVTVNLPVSAASLVSLEQTDWIVPGLLEEKIAGLIRALPKIFRKQLVPVNETVERIMKEMPLYRGSLKASLSRFIYERFGVDIPVSEWREEELPEHLRLRFAITGSDGKELAAGRDKQVLLEGTSDEIQPDVLAKERAKWEKDGLDKWDLPDLPKAVEVTSGKNCYPVYPALTAEKDKVALRLFQDQKTALAEHRAGVARLYRQYFSRDLKFLKKTVALPSSAEQAAAYFGGRKKLETQVVDRIMTDLFAENIRTEADFYAHARAQADRMLSGGQALQQAVVPVLEQYGRTREMIYKLELRHGQKPLLSGFLNEMRRSLERLVPQNFVMLYSRERLFHMPRYLKALYLRAERGVVDLEKDQKKAEQVKPFSDELSRFLETLDQTASHEKREAVETFFWMIEEFKVSLFAQELKTPYPISAKKLKNQADKIRRMV